MVKKENSNPSKDHSLSISQQQNDCVAQRPAIITHTFLCDFYTTHTATEMQAVLPEPSAKGLGEGTAKP